ncbi:hypothetical protein [Streptomyces sp. NPDC058291]|uniref:hypothetical protein n=1 Tax=Streptomyces sp. NPDC058291 TaxID=3346427 RepID=UPI0036E931F5
MGIRMLHRRKAHARVHATAADDTRAAPGTAPRKRPRPARAPRAATPRLPRTPATALRTPARILRTAAARLPRPALVRLVLARLLPLARRGVPRSDALRRWAEAVSGRLAAPARAVVGRLLGPRTTRHLPVFVATAPPLTERPDGSAAH